MALPRVAPPFPVSAPHQVVPAPRPLGDAPHVVLDDAWPAAVARRLERLTDEVVVRDPVDPDDAGLAGALRAAWGLLPGDGLRLLGVEMDLAAATARQVAPSENQRATDEVVVRDPVDPDDAGLAAALRAAWGLLPGDGPRLLGVEVDLAAATARQVAPSENQRATDEVVRRTGLDLLVVGWLLACSDDLVVLRRRGAGLLAAELLAVTFPSGWPVRRRAGASLLELHAPVADGDRLQRAAPALSEALLTKGPYVQHVWGIDPNGRLDQDPDVDYPEQPVRWHLRVERQTTLPLPRLDRALFTIRPYLTPIEALTPEQRRTLGAALASLSPAAKAYKGVPDDLIAQLCDGSSG